MVAQAQPKVASLVDFTADWCLTCPANKKIAIEIESVGTARDWRVWRCWEITTFLRRF